MSIIAGMSGNGLVFTNLPLAPWDMSTMAGLGPSALSMAVVSPHESFMG